MNETIIGFAIIAVTGAWVSLLAAAAFWLYNALGPVNFGIAAALVILTAVAVIVVREWNARNEETK